MEESSHCCDLKVIKGGYKQKSKEKEEVEVKSWKKPAGKGDECEGKHDSVINDEPWLRPHILNSMVNFILSSSSLDH